MVLKSSSLPSAPLDIMSSTTPCQSSLEPVICVIGPRSWHAVHTRVTTLEPGASGIFWAWAAVEIRARTPIARAESLITDIVPNAIGAHGACRVEFTRHLLLPQRRHRVYSSRPPRRH